MIQQLSQAQQYNLYYGYFEALRYQDWEEKEVAFTKNETIKADIG